MFQFIGIIHGLLILFTELLKKITHICIGIFSISKALSYVVCQVVLTVLILFNAYLLSTYLMPGSERPVAGAVKKAGKGLFSLGILRGLWLEQ